MKHIIWSSRIDMNDWPDLKDEHPDLSEEELYELASEINEDYYYDERVNLDKELGRPIVMFADLGVWSGRKKGCKLLGGTNLNTCLTGQIGDIQTWYVEGDEVKCEDVHHDGTNYYTYRILKKKISLDDFADMLASKDWKEIYQNQTEPLGHYVAEIYGFEV